MSVAEVIAEIRALPREDQDKVVQFVTEELASETPTPKIIRRKSFEEASNEVFTEYSDLLQKLSK